MSAGLLFPAGAAFSEIPCPCTGAVLDAQTGAPIKGASVLVYWTKVITYPMGRDTILHDAVLVYTDAKGRYSAPPSAENYGLLAQTGSTFLIVYEPGYEAYIAEDGERWRSRVTFPAKDNAVKLKRILPNFSHDKHVREIENALRGFETRAGSYPEDLERHWDESMSVKLKDVKKIEFMRMIEWEKRRANEEEVRD